MQISAMCPMCNFERSDTVVYSDDVEFCPKVINMLYYSYYMKSMFDSLPYLGSYQFFHRVTRHSVEEEQQHQRQCNYNQPFQYGPFVIVPDDVAY